MMNYLLFWLLFIVIISGLSIILDRHWEKRQRLQAQQEPTMMPQGVTATLTNAGAMITELAARLANQWQRQLNGHQAVVDIPAFRTWLRALFAADSLEQHWLTSLSDEQLQILYRGVATFAEDLGFDLAWLLATKPFKHPTVEQAAQEIVLNYLRSWQQAMHVQQDVQEMKRYQALLANPLLPENQQFAQQLHTHLVKEKLATPTPTAVCAAGEQAEQAFFLQTIQVAAHQQPLAFSRALRITIAVSKAAAQVAATDVATPVNTA
jgi:hypothetical protein